MSRRTGTELDEMRNNIKIDIMSILFSEKDGLTERELIREYYKLKEQSIPYAILGYLNIFDLMKAPIMKNSVRIERRGPSWVYVGIHTEETKALGNMVKNQLDLLKSKREKSRTHDALRNLHLASNGKMQIPHNVQKAVEEILKEEKNFEITSEKFEREYLLKTGFDFNSKEFGYQTSCELFESLSHLVHLTNKSNNQFKMQLVVKSKEKNENTENLNKVEETLATAIQSEHENSSFLETKMTFEEEIIDNLKQVIDVYCQEPTPLSAIISLYQQHTQKDLEIHKLGYTDIGKFLSEKLPKHFRVKPGELDHFIMSKSSKIQLEALSSSDSSIEDSDSDDIDSDDNQNGKLEILKNQVRKTLEGHTNKIVPFSVFLNMFEKKVGHPLNPHDYNQRTMDHLLKRLIRSKTITTRLTDEFKQAICLLPNDEDKQRAEKMIKSKPKANIQNGTSYHKNKIAAPEREMTKEELIKYRADLKQEFVLGDEDLDQKDIWKDFLKSKTININVSFVKNPCEFNIQLVENKYDLENLMNELEMTYCGFGASYYDMPVEYVTIGRYCAGLFPFDNNWHRCKIVEVFTKTKEARVSYIDYGGTDILKFSNLKFLDKKFAKIPIQIVTAKLFNIKKPMKNIWPDNVQKYLLDLLKNKTLVATIMGINNTDCTASFSLDLTMITKTDSASGFCPRGTSISINTRVVQDGFGEFYDETMDIDYITFETFRKEQQDVFDLEEIAENRNLVSEILEAYNNPAIKKDLNNETVDEESSPIFRRPLNGIKSKRQTYPKASNARVLLFRINRVVYAHWKQISDLLRIDRQDFWDCLSRLDKEEFISKIKRTTDSKPLFDTLSEELGMANNIEHLFEFGKLGKLLELLYRDPLLTMMKKKFNL